MRIIASSHHFSHPAPLPLPPTRGIPPHPTIVSGGSLQRMESSTSRATGKLTASLVVTTACLPQTTAPPSLPLDHSVRRERLGRRLSSSSLGFAPVDSSREKEINAENRSPGTIPVAAAGDGGRGPQTVAPPVESQAEKQRNSSSSGTNKLDESTIGADDEARRGGGAGWGERGEQKESMLPPHCRERSSGQLRGGDLM